jgi:hypothetical protein
VFPSAQTSAPHFQQSYSAFVKPEAVKVTGLFAAPVSEIPVNDEDTNTADDGRAPTINSDNRRRQTGHKHQLYARNKHLENPSQYQSKAQRADSKETHQKSHNPTGDNKQYAANKTSDNTTMDLNTRYKEGKNYSKKYCGNEEMPD